MKHLDGIWRSSTDTYIHYTEAIDAGRGSEVAAAFRAEAKRVQLMQVSR